MSRSRSTSRSLRSSALMPLLDTLFLLLFTLLATSRSATLVEESVREEISVSLPDVADGGASDSDVAARVLVIGVGADSAIEAIAGRRADGRALPVQSPAAIGSLVATLRESDSAARWRAEIRADEDARHGAVLDVLQEVRRAGITDVRFIAVTKSEEAR